MLRGGVLLKYPQQNYYGVNIEDSHALALSFRTFWKALRLHDALHVGRVDIIIYIIDGGVPSKDLGYGYPHHEEYIKPVDTLG